MRRTLAPLALVLACAAGPALAENPDAVLIQTTHVAGKVWMLEGRGGNIGVSVGDDGMVLIDDEFAQLADKIQAALPEHGMGKLRFVLNTHWHGDHTGGNAVFGLQAPILAHTNVRKRLSTTQKAMGKAVDPSPKEALPILTYDEGISLHLNGEEIRATHYENCHTDSDTVVLFVGSNVLHMGDLFFPGRFPFVDLDSGGDVPSLTRNIRRILDTLPADVKIIPGHGPLSTAADLEKYYTMLVKTTDVVRRAIDSGRTLKQIQNEGLPPEWTDWGSGYITTSAWLETVYRSLAERPGKGS
jgi:cyclase